MRKIIAVILMSSVLGATFLGAPLSVNAQDSAPAKTATAPKAKHVTKVKKKVSPAKATAFNGKVTATDKIAMTVTVSAKSKSRTLAVTSASRLFIHEKPATFAAIAVGDQVKGRAHVTAAGAADITTLTVTKKATDKKDATVKPKKAQ